MTTKFELWTTSDGYCLLQIPTRSRLSTIQEQGANLLLRFEVERLADAVVLMERYLYDENPDGFIPLNIPGTQFLFHDYISGVRPGEVVVLKMDYHCMSDGVYFGFFEKGTVFYILPGDINAREDLWMRVLEVRSENHTVGQYHSVPNNVHFFTYFSRLAPLSQDPVWD